MAHGAFDLVGTRIEEPHSGGLSRSSHHGTEPVSFDVLVDEFEPIANGKFEPFRKNCSLGIAGPDCVRGAERHHERHHLARWKRGLVRPVPDNDDYGCNHDDGGECRPPPTQPGGPVRLQHSARPHRGRLPVHKDRKIVFQGVHRDSKRPFHQNDPSIVDGVGHRCVSHLDLTVVGGRDRRRGQERILGGDQLTDVGGPQSMKPVGEAAQVPDQGLGSVPLRVHGDHRQRHALGILTEAGQRCTEIEQGRGTHVGTRGEAEVDEKNLARLGSNRKGRRLAPGIRPHDFGQDHTAGIEWRLAHQTPQDRLAIGSTGRYRCEKAHEKHARYRRDPTPSLRTLGELDSHDSSVPGTRPIASGPMSVPFLDACTGRIPDRTPVWFMRQAGRSLPEYRQVRGDGSILTAIAQPELAAEITLQPVRRYGVDAAVLYSDIVVPAHAVGFGIDVAPGTGPVAERPLRHRDDLARLIPFEPRTHAAYVSQTVEILARELDESVPLLAFAGAPFTVGSYLIEGRPSRDYRHTKALMVTEEALWHEVMERLTQHAVASINDQLAAGARAYQVFDSWAGALSARDYDRYVAPHSAAVFEQVSEAFPDAPAIHFGIGCGHLLDSMYAAMSAVRHRVIGLDWRTPIGEARERLGPDTVVQGNLDPAVVLAGHDAAIEGARRVLEDNRRPDNNRHPGHVFNLGHGVQPATDPDVLAAVVHTVHDSTRGDFS
jgi:uroporphyrinogen decarboxylase